MKKCALQNALQSRLSACAQQEPSEAVPQATAFALSALSCPPVQTQLTEGHEHGCRLGGATDLSRTTVFYCSHLSFLFLVHVYCGLALLVVSKLNIKTAGIQYFCRINLFFRSYMA